MVVRSVSFFRFDEQIVTVAAAKRGHLKRRVRNLRRIFIQSSVILLQKGGHPGMIVMIGVDVESVQRGKKGNDIPPCKIGKNRLDHRVFQSMRRDQIGSFIEDPTAIRGGENEIILHIFEKGQ